VPARPRIVEVRNLVGVQEICHLAGGVPRSTLARWRRGSFPKPIKKLRIGELWDLAQVRPWLVARDVALALGEDRQEPTSWRLVDRRDPGVYEILVRDEVFGRVRVNAKGEGVWI
jgi:hypothetical protein